MILRSVLVPFLLVAATLPACSGGDPEGEGKNDAESMNDPGTGSEGEPDGSDASSSDGSTETSTGGGASTGGGTTDAELEEQLALAEDLCDNFFVRAQLLFGERDEGSDFISSRITSDDDTSSSTSETLARDTLLGSYIEMTWDTPVADGEETGMKGYFQYGSDTTYTKCFDGVVRVRTSTNGGTYYVFASQKLSYADENGNCSDMPETGYVRGCIDDEY